MLGLQGQLEKNGKALLEFRQGSVSALEVIHEENPRELCYLWIC
jgi:hypothetical protein